ncbi:MAG: hypothetical protein JWQ06_1068 [Mucilaginibacter sp.]|nr:hypothetical protein [Mucilaginibacter sp.]
MVVSSFLKAFNSLTGKDSDIIKTANKRFQILKDSKLKAIHTIFLITIFPIIAIGFTYFFIIESGKRIIDLF